MKLKTEHLAPYLPYNLKCEVLNSGQEKEIGEMIAVYDDNSACFGNIIESEKGFEYIKPILKPMLDFEAYFAKIFETDKDVNEYRDWETDRKSTRLNSSHRSLSRMPSSA